MSICASTKRCSGRQATLVAHWMSLGFIHGVMNTDNMAISGETIDYGPCAFMDAYDPATKFSFVDEFGRYAYANQPRIAPWNLARLAEALLPHVDEDKDAGIETLGAVLGTFPEPVPRRLATPYARQARPRAGGA